MIAKGSQSKGFELNQEKGIFFTVLTRPSNESAVTRSLTGIAKHQLGLSALELIGVIALAAMIFVFAATSSNGVASEADL